MKTPPEWTEKNGWHTLRLASGHVTAEVSPVKQVRIGTAWLPQTFPSVDEAKAEAVRLTRLALQDAIYDLDRLKMAGDGGYRGVSVPMRVR